MALGRFQAERNTPSLLTAKVGAGMEHPFYAKLNSILTGAHFDDFVEQLCAPYYKKRGRPGIPPGIYFRMLFIGYFEGLESQRSIAWRCADSLGLRTFLGIAPHEDPPTHASMTMIRQRLPEPVFNQIFTFMLSLLVQNGLLRGKSMAVAPPLGKLARQVS